MSKTTALESRTRVMALILARDGALMKTTNGAGAEVWVLTEQVQNFVDKNLQEFIGEES